MLVRLISGDRPRSVLLSVVLIAIAVGLAFAPFLFPGTRSLDTAARICIFIALVASYDLLLGYTGIVSFAHTMFFGLGAYGVAIALKTMGPSFAAVALGAALGTLAAALLALLIGLFSLRVRAIFFAMVTLAVASAFELLVSQLSFLTGGEDGLNYTIPFALTPGFRLFEERVLGVAINGRLHRLLPDLLCLRRAIPADAAGRQLAVRPRAAGGARERLPRRGHRLSRGLLPHRRHRPVGRHGGAGWRTAGAVAALHGARHHTVA